MTDEEFSNKDRKLFDEIRNVYHPESLENVLRRIGNDPLFKALSSSDFRIPKKPEILEGPPKYTKVKKTKERVQEILSPLDKVFFEPELMDELIVRTSVPQLLEGKLPIYPGAILYGSPGTGKSEFQRALCRVYENAGAYSKQVSSSKVNSIFVSGLAGNLENELAIASEQAELRRLPSFLSFDEGSTFAEKAERGAGSVSRHYQEAIDVLKRYIGNDTGKWLVLAISTNSLPEDFEDAMTREGRLTSFLIPPPSKIQIARMWEYFLLKYNVLKIDKKQAGALAEISQDTNGALISQFSKAYFTNRRHKLLVAQGCSDLLCALRTGKDIRELKVRESITYETVANDLKEYLSKLTARENGETETKKSFGFAQVVKV